MLDGAVDLVGGDVQEAVDADLAGDVAQHVGAVAVGAHEGVGRHDRAVDVALGGEVHDRVVAGHGCGDGLAVADVALHEAVARVVVHVAQGGEVAGVGEHVEDRDLVVGGGEHVADVVRADEPGTTGDEQPHAPSPPPPPETVEGRQAVAAQVRRLPLRLDVGAPRVLLVARGQDRIGDAPVGLHRRVVPRHAQLVGRVVVAVDEVGDGHVGERREAVRHARRDEHAPVRLGAVGLHTQVERERGPVGGRARSAGRAAPPGRCRRGRTSSRPGGGGSAGRPRRRPGGRHGSPGPSPGPAGTTRGGTSRRSTHARRRACRGRRCTPRR